MKTVMMFLVCISAAVGSAFAMTCDETGRVCTEVTTTNVTTVYNIDELVSRKKWLKARNAEIDESVTRDTERYVTVPRAEKTKNKAEIASINSILSGIESAGGNVTEEDETASGDEI